MKMTWDTSVLKPSLLRPKFESIKETINAFGKMITTIEPSDIIFSSVPMDASVGKEWSCKVHLSKEISGRGFEDSLKVTISHSDALILRSNLVKKKDVNSWTVSFMPDKPGEHAVKVQIGSVSSLAPGSPRAKIKEEGGSLAWPGTF